MNGLQRAILPEVTGVLARMDSKQWTVANHMWIRRGLDVPPLVSPRGIVLA